MIRALSTFFLGLLPCFLVAQNFELLTSLNNTVSEGSGIIYLNGRIIVNKDSGNAPNLFEIDSLTGNVLRTVEVVNATNVGWEDLAYDDTYIYIADIGNNTGERTDLKVLRISQSDYFEVDNDIVTAEVISFNYEDQIDFTPAQYATNFDAQTLISLQDSLYIFTKNWLTFGSYIYPLSKIPGSYTISKKDSIGGNSLVSGGEMNEDTGELILTTYAPFAAKALSITNFAGDSFSQGSLQYINLPVSEGYSYQMEGITRISPGSYLLIAENSFSGDAGLYKLSFSPLQVKKHTEESMSVYPNPASEYFNVSGAMEIKVNIYDHTGRLVKTTTNHLVTVSDLAQGQYVLQIRGSGNQLISTQKLIVQ